LTIIHVALLAVFSFALGAVIQVLLPLGAFTRGYLITSLLIFISCVVLYFAWRWAGKEKVLAWMMVIAFVIRLALAVFLAWGLPRFGYDEPPQKAGFVFFDAYNRESSAWDLSQSDESLTAAFSDTYGSDQYGGILALSAAIYRILSPDAFRPVLLSILSAGVMALGLPFFYSITKQNFGVAAALWGGWAFALFPEGILLGAAQMREPFMILFFVMAFWGAAQLRDRTKIRSAIFYSLIGALGLILLSYRVAIPVLAAILLWFWVESSVGAKKKWVALSGWLGIVLLGMIAYFIFRNWIIEVFRWDALLTFRASGMIQAQLERLPRAFHLPFIVTYGIFQPVLPAAIVDPAPWIWRGLAIIRALGWYSLLPFLIYALFRVWKLEKSSKRRWLILFILIVWFWVMISSLRAGGDQWDNPRYRTIFLPWMALIFGWVIDHVSQKKDAWLYRILMVEGIFLFFFTAWYVDRYYLPNFSLNFLLIVALIFIFSVLIFVWGMVVDRKQKHSLTEKDEKL
jgi:peptidoglycan/LPS O-acetylase OafA/YrhL